MFITHRRAVAKTNSEESWMIEMPVKDSKAKPDTKEAAIRIKVGAFGGLHDM